MTLLYSLTIGTISYVTSKLIQQGFRYTGLCVAFKTFSRTHACIFSTVFWKHIQEGICLPATVRVDLAQPEVDRYMC